MPRRPGFKLGLNRDHRVMALGIVLVALLGLGTVIAYLMIFRVQPFVSMVDQITVYYGDGTSRVFNSDDALAKLWSQAVLTQDGQKLMRVDRKSYLMFSVRGVSTKVKTQYWAIYWMRVTGPAGAGARIMNAPVFGNVEAAWLTDYGSKTMDANRWVFLSNGILGYNALSSYYMERGTGLQVGNLNVGPDLAVAVDQAMTGPAGAIAKPIADTLTTLLGTSDVQDGQKETIFDWSKDGPTLYTDMWSVAYPWQLWLIQNIPGGTACIPLTSTCAGFGAFLRMHINDQYTLQFMGTVFYRWQDSTGFWTDWQVENKELAHMNVKCSDGFYTVLNVVLV